MLGYPIAFSKKSRLIRGSPFSVFELFTHAIIMDFNANFGPVSYKGSDRLIIYFSSPVILVTVTLIIRKVLKKEYIDLITG